MSIILALEWLKKEEDEKKKWQKKNQQVSTIKMTEYNLKRLRET